MFDNSELTSILAIHGDKQQNERDWVLNEFKTGKSPIMVATDVASRGIGMIKTPYPYATPSRLYNSALLSTLRRFLDCVLLPGFFRVLWFSLKGCLGSAVQHISCYASNSKLKVLSLVRDVELASLDLIKLSPRLPNQRTWMCGSPTLALNPQWTVHVNS
jgi:hypothetical protein